MLVVSHLLPGRPYLWNEDDSNRAYFLELLGTINGIRQAKRLDQALAYTKFSLDVSYFEGAKEHDPTGRTQQLRLK